MAKKLSRAERKAQKQKQQYIKTNKQIIAQRQAEKQLQQKLAEERRQARKIEAKKQQKSAKQRELDNWKRNTLEALGFDKKYLTYKNIRKVKKADILDFQKAQLLKMNNGDIDKIKFLENKLSFENYPYLYPESYFDFQKVYHLPPNNGLYFAYLDYTGEHSLIELFNDFMKKSDETLITLLDGIVHQPTTGKKVKGKWQDSSGRAGTFKHAIYSENVARLAWTADNNTIIKNIDNAKHERWHTGTYRYYQSFSDDDGFTIKSIKGHEILALLNALFYNTVENDRGLYETVYNNIIKYIPDFKTFLPIP